MWQWRGTVEEKGEGPGRGERMKGGGGGCRNVGWIEGEEGASNRGGMGDG